VDVVHHKESVCKACVQPWNDKAFMITVNIEGKLTHIQGMHVQMQGITLDTEVSEEQMQQV